MLPLASADRAAKLSQMGLLWFAALLLSGALVLAGRRWPQPPPSSAGVVWTLLLAPSLLLGLWLLRHWSLPAADQGGQSEAIPQEPQ